MSPYQPQEGYCPVCKVSFMKLTAASKYCSPKCCAQNTHIHRRKNVPNYRTIAEIEAEWLPEQKRLTELGILVVGLNDKLMSKNNARRAELRNKKRGRA